MSTEQNKAVYRRFIEEVFNQGQFATLDEVLVAGYVDRDAPSGTPPGPEGIKQIVTMFRAAFPDLRITIEEQVAEGETVANRTTFQGTHRGALFGIAATGRSVTMSGLTMVHLEKGRITESWVKNDVMGLMQQLGATPGSPGAPA